MAVVRLRISPDPAHVRVVRLVAAATARRAGVDEDLIEEIKLAVGEACGLAVDALEPSSAQHIDVEFDDGAPFNIVVRTPVDLERLSAADDGPNDGTGLTPDGLAIVRGLIEEVTVSSGDAGSVVSMTWPAPAGDEHRLEYPRA